MAFHYPLENYLDLFHKVCDENTEFIFDFSSEKYNETELEKYFSKVEIIYEEVSQHPLKRVHCKNYIKN